MSDSGQLIESPEDNRALERIRTLEGFGDKRRPLIQSIFCHPHNAALLVVYLPMILCVRPLDARYERLSFNAGTRSL